MSDRKELEFEDLEAVNGGQISYTWNGTSGSIGINGNNVYVLVDKAAFLEYYHSVEGTMSDSQILKNLKAMGIAKKA
ncbi:MAG: hypothetical protein IJQ33_08140 [Clostridia bacterium]|nr:hypothetical protein [Clostridia bacterium]